MRALAALLLSLLAASAAAAQPYASRVDVVRVGDRWTAEFRFNGQAGAWMFRRSELTRVGDRAWRPQGWRVETPGVRIERRGQHDVIVAERGAVPRRVRVVFTPAALDLQMGYDPALVFTNGAVALYTEQFVTVPMASAAAVDALPLDLNGIELTRSQTRLSFRDSAGPVLLAGRRLPLARLRDDDGDGTYILFGAAEPVVSDDMAAIFDPQLPAWIRASLSRHVPEIFARYTRVLGPPPGPRPTIMVSWAGPSSGVVSMGGSTLQGLITMAYEGERLVSESPQARSFGLWFIAHEAAHFWLGNAVSYEFARDAWITEGGADLLAFRTVAEVDPGYDWRAAINESIADCATLSTGRGVASADERNEQRAYYACGAVFSLVAEAASRRPFIQFVHTLVEENRADHFVSRADWLSALDRASNDPSLSREIGALLDRGAADPKAAIAALFTRAGVPFTLAADGMPRVA